jgi:DNA-binding response OmpR family regulator
MLEAHGFAVVSVDGVRNARRTLSERDDITASLLDIGLPDGSGLDLYRWIAEHRPALATRVAFLTGSADDLPPGLLSSLGRPILRKPFDVADLVQLVTELGGASEGGSD